MLSLLVTAAEATIFEKVEVLAANPTTKRAAIRLTTSLDSQAREDEDPQPPLISCRSPGMGKGSTSGVTLLLWSFETNAAVGTFVVYGVARSRSECTPRAESASQLAAAKKAFAAAGLDLTKRPASADLSAKACTVVTENEGDACGWTKTETCTLNGVVISTDEEEANCGPFVQTTRDRDWYVVGDTYFFVELTHTSSLRGSSEDWAVSPLVVVPGKVQAKTPR